jgi:hypothetical protein
MDCESVEALKQALAQESYIWADRGLAAAGFLALAMRRPLLLEGEAGVGETRSQGRWRRARPSAAVGRLRARREHEDEVALTPLRIHADKARDGGIEPVSSATSRTSASHGTSCSSTLPPLTPTRGFRDAWSAALGRRRSQ